MNETIFIVIPAFNEGKNIGSVLLDLLHAGYSNIVVVDDCSEDNTLKVVSGFPVFLLHHAINRGQGASLKTGIDFALKEGADIIITFDSDGQHLVTDLPAMLEPITRKEADMTVGSRFLKRTDVPFFRKILLKGSVGVLFLFYRIKMSDAHNGLRVLSRSAAEKISITCDRMAHASEIIEEMHKKGIRFREVPITVRYTNETLKKGHGSYLGAFKVLTAMALKKIGR